MLTDLGDFLPVDVNDRGQIAGYTSRIGAQAASFRWQDGTLTDVGSLGAYTYAAAIDLYGTVVGRAGKVSIAGVSDVGFVWRHGTFTELGTDGGVRNPTAVSLNDVGHVVVPVAARVRQVEHGAVLPDGVGVPPAGVQHRGPDVEDVHLVRAGADRAGQRERVLDQFPRGVKVSSQALDVGQDAQRVRL